MRNQKGRKTYLIQSFGIPAALLEQMADAIGSQNTNTRASPLNKSEWICRAIRRDIAHMHRSRRSRTARGNPSVRHVTGATDRA
jgi:hypothetical protein